MENKKRERSANFDSAEIQLLINLVAKFKNIVENKKTDAVTNKDKEAAWRQIEENFNSCGVSTNARSWKTLKLKYEGIKKNTKKKSSLQRQEMYKTGGGPSKAPEFSEIDEKVLSICSNITGLEPRHDSDTISKSTPLEEVEDSNIIFEIEEIPENSFQPHPVVDLAIGEIVEDNQKENNWDKWHPKALKSRVSNVLKPNVSKASVTAKLDKLSEARLELVQLQMKTAKLEHQFMEEEHKLKMLHLANDERRKEELHSLQLKQNGCNCGAVQIP
ncbi:uncharacterized protein LOC126055652 [Helicoverpa armigera]|uniref:uncharacterized protein LOC126055652 n=2 Tax=Helicoverpa armigera TaxID=29058 RepID=UPI00308330E6